MRASNSQHMDMRWLPAIQSGLHYLAHAGIIKESDQRADYCSAAGSFSVCSFFMSFFISLCCLWFSSFFLSAIRYSANADHMDASITATSMRRCRTRFARPHVLGFLRWGDRDGREEEKRISLCSLLLSCSGFRRLPTWRLCFTLLIKHGGSEFRSDPNVSAAPSPSLQCSKYNQHAN